MKDRICSSASQLVAATMLMGLCSLAQAQALPGSVPSDDIAATQPTLTTGTSVRDSPVSTLYTIRAQVMEGANLAQTFMSAVARAYAVSGYSQLADVAFNGLLESGNYVEYIFSINGRIEITYGNLADTAIAGKTLSLTPYRSPDFHVVWRCGNNPAPPNLDLLPGAQYQVSTVDAQYLTAACATIGARPDTAPNRGDVLRSYVAGGIKLAKEAQRIIQKNKSSIESFNTAVETYNSHYVNGPHINSILINPANGAVTITYGRYEDIWIRGATIVITPSIQSVSLVDAINQHLAGTVEWACASSTSIYANSQGLPAISGTLQARFAPEECQ